MVSSLCRTKPVMLPSLLPGDIPSDPAQGGISGSRGQVPQLQVANTPLSFREIQDEELQKFCSRVAKLLQKDEPGPDAVDALQRLFLIVSATKYKRR